MDFKKVSLAFVAALAAGALFSACPGETGTLYGDCTGDLTCSSGEICHPDAKVCVKTCESADDCGAEAKTCAEVKTGSDQKVCQCSTDELCAGFEAGLSCDLGTAVCKGEGGSTDKSCQGEAQSTCSYGEFCSNSECTAAPQATASCENIVNGPGITWKPESGTGPVIYSVETIAPVAAFPCDNADQVKFSARVKAYNANDKFPATRQQLGNFFYVKVNGQQVDAGLFLMRDAQYKLSNESKNGEFDLTFCTAPGSTQIQIGLYFTKGNEVCHTIK